jgi:hypothetical protein
MKLKKAIVPGLFLIIGLLVGVLLGYSSHKGGFLTCTFISSDDLSDLPVSAISMTVVDMNAYLKSLLREQKPYRDIRAFLVLTETGHRLDFIYAENHPQVDKIVRLVHKFVSSKMLEIQKGVSSSTKNIFEHL